MLIRNIRITLIILLLSFGLNSLGYSQLFFPEDMVNVKGQVIDELTKEAVGYVQVINMRIRGGTMTDANGNFSVQADPMDTLTFKSLNYKDKKVPVSSIINTENGVAKSLFHPHEYCWDKWKWRAPAPK